jgi:hypothetical protein
MPSLTGVRLPDAEAQLPGGVETSHEDRSPRGRSVFVKSNWTVVETEPATGEPVAPGQRVHLFVLKNEEAAWFAEHPTMPKIKTGTDGLHLTGDGEPFDGIWELIEYRYPKGRAPKDADNADENVKGWEPAEEKTARAGLKTVYGSFGLVVGTIPTPRQKVRPGRLIVITMRDKPRGRTSGSTKLPNHSDGDDDDVNVPGWICPTRFC